MSEKYFSGEEGGRWAKHVGDREEWKKKGVRIGIGIPFRAFLPPPPPPLFAPARQAKRVSDVNPMAWSY